MAGQTPCASHYMYLAWLTDSMMTSIEWIIKHHVYYMYITSTLHEKLIIIRPVLHGWSNTMWTCLWNYIASWKDMIIVGQTNSNFFSLCELMWRALICIANDPKKTMHTTYKNWWSITSTLHRDRSQARCSENMSYNSCLKLSTWMLIFTWRIIGRVYTNDIQNMICVTMILKYIICILIIL